MKLIFCMLMKMEVFYKLKILIRDVQTTWVNLQYLCNILRKKTGTKSGNQLHYLFKYYSYNLLYVQCSPTIDLFPQYGIHTKPFLHLINCLCNISSLSFQVMVGPCKLTCYIPCDESFHTALF